MREFWALTTMRQIRDEFGSGCLVLGDRSSWAVGMVHAYLCVVALVSHHKESRSAFHTLADLIGGWNWACCLDGLDLLQPGGR